MENRIIKFRFWTGEMMEYWNHVQDWESLGFYLNGGDGYVPMQFTGLLDKNGKEIYEGDIVKGNRTKEGFFADGRFIQGFSGSGQTCMRSFEYREVKFEITDRSISINLPKDITYSERSEPIHWEVVGNVHQNPELLAPEK